MVYDTHFDPAAMAYALGDDTLAIYEFVRDDVAYQAYPGLLRFGGGTLMNLAGNSCDQAALLGEMLDAAGTAVRYASAPMTPGLQERLRMIADLPATAATLPEVFPQTVADRAEDLLRMGLTEAQIDELVALEHLQAERFIRETEDGLAFFEDRFGAAIAAVPENKHPGAAPGQTVHCWIEALLDDGWIAMDPAAQWLSQGAAALVATEVSEGLSLDLAPLLSVRLDVTDGGADVARTLMDVETNLFRPVNEMRFTINPANHPDLPATRGPELFVPVLEVNGRRYEAEPIAMSGPVTSGPLGNLGGTFDGFGNELACIPTCAEDTEKLGKGRDMGPDLVTMTITLRNVAGQTVSESRTLVAAPEDLPPQDRRADVQRQLALSYEAILSGGRISHAYVEARQLDAILAAEPVFQWILEHRLTGRSRGDPVQLLNNLSLPPIEALQHAQVRTAIAEHLAASLPRATAHVGFPQMIARRSGYLTVGPGHPAEPVLGWDIVSQGYSTQGQEAAGLATRLGMADTVVEALHADLRGRSAYTALLETEETGAEIRVLLPDDSAARPAIDVSAARSAIDVSVPASSLLEADLAEGFAVLAIVPSDTEVVSEWVRFHPETGAFLGRNAIGGGAKTEHSALISGIIDKAVKATAFSMASCLAFHAFTPTLGNYQSWWSGEGWGDMQARSENQHFGEFMACWTVGAAVGFIGLVVFSEIAVAAVAGVSFSALQRMRASRGPGVRPAPPRAPEATLASARPASAPEPGFGQPSNRPAAAGGPRPAAFESREATILDRPPRSMRTGTGTAVDGRSAPRPRQEIKGPRTASEQFNHVVDHLFGPGTGDSLNFAIAKARWEQMTPRQRKGVRDAYRHLRRAAPGIDRQILLRKLLEPGRLLPPSHAGRVAQGAMEAGFVWANPPVAMNLRALARAGGVSPGHMRRLLQERLDATHPENGRRFTTDPDGTLRLSRQEPAFRNLDDYGIRLAEMAGGDPKKAAADARIRARVDRSRGINAEESVAGLAAVRDIPIADYLGRTGQTRQEAFHHLRKFHEKSGLSPDAARAAARRYVTPDGGGTGLGRSGTGAAPSLPMRADRVSGPPNERAVPPEGDNAPRSLDPEVVSLALRDRESALLGPEKLGALADLEAPVGVRPADLAEMVKASDRLALTPEQQASLALREKPISLTTDQIARLRQKGRSETLAMSAEHRRRLDASEGLALTPDEFAAVADSSKALTPTPDQSQRLARAKETITMTPEQLRAVSQDGGVGRVSLSELRDVMREQRRKAGLDPDAVQLNEADIRSAVRDDFAIPLTPEEGVAMIDRLAGGRSIPPKRRGQVSGDKLLNPDLPPEAEFQTPQARQRMQDSEGLLPSERRMIAKFESELKEISKDSVTYKDTDIRKFFERMKMREIEAVRQEGSVFREKVAVARSRYDAPEFPVPRESPVFDKPQVGINNGHTPRRQLVEGDQAYLASIMGDSRFVPSQKRVFTNSINRAVEIILTEGRFPDGPYSGSSIVRLQEFADGSFVIADGHHRVIAAQIASRLTGRPVLPRDVPPGSPVQPIIPETTLNIVPRVSAPEGRTGAIWKSLGVLEGDAL